MNSLKSHPLEPYRNLEQHNKWLQEQDRNKIILEEIHPGEVKGPKNSKNFDSRQHTSGLSEVKGKNGILVLVMWSEVGYCCWGHRSGFPPVPQEAHVGVSKTFLCFVKLWRFKLQFRSLVFNSSLQNIELLYIHRIKICMSFLQSGIHVFIYKEYLSTLWPF